MVSNIFFGSTFKVTNKNNSFEKFSKFQNYAGAKKAYDEAQVAMRDKLDPILQKYSAAVTMVVPDSVDNEIEHYCSYNGIQFTKKENNELLNHDEIKKRISEPKTGMHLVHVNSSRLENLAENHDSNMKHCKNNYDKYYNEKIDFMIKSGEDIPATTLYLATPDIADPVLDSNNLFIDFNQETDMPDHCMYFGLKEAGMETIPMYVNDETLALGSELGIFEE